MVAVVESEVVDDVVPVVLLFLALVPRKLVALPVVYFELLSFEVVEFDIDVVLVIGLEASEDKGLSPSSSDSSLLLVPIKIKSCNNLCCGTFS